MGYDVNMMIKYFAPNFKNYVLTSSDTSLWNLSEGDRQRIDKEFEEKFNCRIIRVPFFKLGKNQTTPILLNVQKNLKRIKPDFTFVHGFESHAFAFCIRSLISQKGSIGLDTHTLYNQLNKAGFLWRMYKRFYFNPIIVKKINKSNCPVFYTAKDNKKVLRDYFGIDENKLFSNEISSDLSVFYPVHNEALEKELKESHDEILVMYIGKFDEYKNPHFIFNAFLNIDGKFSKKVHLFFAGPKNEKYFKMHFEPLPKFKNTRITVEGTLKNEILKQYYSLADFCIIPDQNSLSAIDIQACKTPVIMKNDPINYDRIRNEALLFQENSIEDLSKKILFCIQNTNVCKIWGEQGFELVNAEFNYKDTLQNILGLMEGKK